MVTSKLQCCSAQGYETVATLTSLLRRGLQQSSAMSLSALGSSTHESSCTLVMPHSKTMAVSPHLQVLSDQSCRLGMAKYKRYSVPWPFLPVGTVETQRWLKTSVFATVARDMSSGRGLSHTGYRLLITCCVTKEHTKSDQSNARRRNP